MKSCMSVTGLGLSAAVVTDVPDLNGGKIGVLTSAHQVGVETVVGAFFFQPEDGIRDIGVTGVQTCALPIFTAGAALGFLVHNFHPASVFMGDCGSNLLGYLLGAVIVEGSLKTNALIALIGPLVVLAVPFLDTGFVVAKRLKYRRPVYRADRWHFHHRMANIGFSQRRTVLYLYAWMLAMAGLAVALRFVPYSDSAGNLRTGWSLLMGVLFVLVLAASVYLVFVLEILKFRRLDAIRLRRLRPEATEDEIDADVEERLETGEFEAVRRATEE